MIGWALEKTVLIPQPSSMAKRRQNQSGWATGEDVDDARLAVSDDGPRIPGSEKASSLWLYR